MAQLVDSTAPRRGGRQLLLVGSGHGHLQLLARLAAQPLAGVHVTLVAPLARQLGQGHWLWRCKDLGNRRLVEGLRRADG